MVRVLNRNNFLSKNILVTKTQSKQILDDENEGLFVKDSNILTNTFKTSPTPEFFSNLTISFY